MHVHMMETCDRWIQRKEVKAGREKKRQRLSFIVIFRIVRRLIRYVLCQLFDSVRSRD